MPAVPITVSEMVYAALKYVVLRLRIGQPIPPGVVMSLQKVMQAYEKQRNAAVVAHTGKRINAQVYVDAADTKLTDWLEKQAAKDPVARGDFAAWAKEMNDDTP